MLAQVHLLSQSLLPIFKKNNKSLEISLTSVLKMISKLVSFLDQWPQRTAPFLVFAGFRDQ